MNMVINIWPILLFKGITIFPFVACLKDEDLLNLGGEVMKNMFSDPAAAFSQCRMDLMHMGQSSGEPWALKMLDSYAKPPSGVIGGDMTWPGSARTCSSVKAPPSNNMILSGKEFQGRYCRLYWDPLIMKKSKNWSMLMESGACVPSSCEPADLMKFYPFLTSLIGAIAPSLKNLPDQVNLSRVDCPKDVDYTFSGGLIATLTFFTIFLCIVCLGTYLDITKNRLGDMINDKAVSTETAVSLNDKAGKESFIRKAFLCFSIKSNISTILDTKETDPRLSFLHGLRVISIMWIVIGHGQSHASALTHNLVYRLNQAFTPGFQFVQNGFYAVDTFFFISSFLFTYVLLQNSKIQLNFKVSAMLIINRYLRTAPTMLIFLAINMNLVDILFHGHLWHLNSSYAECHATWWTFPLYIQNFFRNNNSCCVWLWYVAVDFQLFVVTIPVMYIFRKSKKVGTIIILAAIVISTILYANAVYNYSIKTFFDYLRLCLDDSTCTAQMADAFYKSHGLPHMRCGAYWLGILFGAYAFKSLNEKPQAKKVLYHYAVKACLATLPFLWVILIPVYVDREDLGNAFFISTSRVIWGLGVILVFDICFHHSTGLLNGFLSWRGWRPLSKLTYCVYLVHPVVIDYVIHANDYMVPTSHKNLTTKLLGILAACYAVAFIFSILFEGPFIRIGKLLAEKRK